MNIITLLFLNRKHIGGLPLCPASSSLLITRCTTNLKCAWRGFHIPILTNLDWKFLWVVWTRLRTICHLYSVMFTFCKRNLVSGTIWLDSYYIMMKLQSHPLQNADTVSNIQYIIINFCIWIQGEYSYIDAKYSTLSFSRVWSGWWCSVEMHKTLFFL